MKNTKKNVGSFAAAKLQANSLRLLGIIALAAVIGFSMTACDDDGDNGGNNNGGQTGGGGGTASVITITNIPAEHIDNFILFQGVKDYNDTKALYGNKHTEAYTTYVGNSYKANSYLGKKITGATVTLNAFQWTTSTPPYQKYTGNDTYDSYIDDSEYADYPGQPIASISITISTTEENQSSGIRRYNAGSVKFTNGSATIDYSTLSASKVRN